MSSKHGFVLGYTVVENGLWKSIRELRHEPTFLPGGMDKEVKMEFFKPLPKIDADILLTLREKQLMYFHSIGTSDGHRWDEIGGWNKRLIDVDILKILDKHEVD